MNFVYYVTSCWILFLNDFLFALIFFLIAIVCLCKSIGRKRNREREREERTVKERIYFKIRMYHSKFLAANNRKQF